MDLEHFCLTPFWETHLWDYFCIINPRRSFTNKVQITIWFASHCWRWRHCDNDNNWRSTASFLNTIVSCCLHFFSWNLAEDCQDTWFIYVIIYWPCSVFNFNLKLICRYCYLLSSQCALQAPNEGFSEEFYSWTCLQKDWKNPEKNIFYNCFYLLLLRFETHVYHGNGSLPGWKGVFW